MNNKYFFNVIGVQKKKHKNLHNIIFMKGNNTSYSRVTNYILEVFHKNKNNTQQIPYILYVVKLLYFLTRQVFL